MLLNQTGREKITSNATRTIHDLIHVRRLEEHWTKRGRLPTGALTDIEQTGLARAMKESTLSRRRFVSKYAGRWLGTRSNLSRWGYRISAVCQLCKQFDERVEHILVCKNPKANIKWFQAMTGLHKWFLEQNTDPGAAAFIIRLLHTWRNGQPPPSTEALGNWNTAFLHQAELGWQGFFDGFISPHWAVLQHQYFRDNNQRKTGKRWATKVIKKMWSLAWDFWELRNELVLEETVRNEAPENEAINLQIDQEYAKGLDRIPARWSGLFQEHAERLKSKSILHRKEWVATVDKL